MSLEDKMLPDVIQPPSWIHHDGFYELEAPQMSTAWMGARQYRLTPSKWSNLDQKDKLTELADSVCGDPIINVNALPQEIQEILHNEDNVRKAYIEAKTKSNRTRMCDIRTPGLIIPDPFNARWDFVPKEDRFLLLHLGCSPDLLWRDTQTKKLVCVELKQPANGMIYPDVLRTKQIRRFHRQQVSGNGGIIQSLYNDYFVWTEKNGSITVQNKTSMADFQRDVLNVLQFVKQHILVRPDSANLELPRELREYYEIERSKID